MNTSTASGSSGTCLNCEASMEAAQSFCGACGQRVVAGRLTMRDIGHDLVHALTHADHGIFRLLRSLALRPGRVAREYIEGKRKKHFGPFAFLVISVGLASFLSLLSGIDWFSPITQNAVSGFLQRHLNLVILIQMPILALLCRGLYFRQRLNYAEHLILTAYTSGFRALFLALVEIPLLHFLGANTTEPRLVILYFCLWAGYFAFAAAQFYRGNVPWIAARAVVAVVLTQVAVVYLIYVVIYVYARFSH